MVHSLAYEDLHRAVISELLFCRPLPVKDPIPLQQSEGPVRAFKSHFKLDMAAFVRL